jgi:16S rRNA (cytosine967-C5)-methyltransferase
MSSVSGLESRHAALLLLLEQEATGAFFKDLFPAGLRDLRDDDAGLARAICFGVLRMRRLLDFNLDAHAPRGIKGAKLRMLLRIGAYQILYLSGVPSFAAVNTTVELVKQEVGRAESGFANAVLKAIARDGLVTPKGNDFKSLAIRYSHPEWMVRRWGRALKPMALEAALQRNNEEAPAWVRANPRRGAPADLPEAVAHDGVVLEAHPELPMFYRVVEGVGPALRSHAFADGFFSFQDPVSAWVVSLLDWHPGLSLLDACAAPGGKSALTVESALARGEGGLALIDQSRIVCGDASPMRLRRLEDARERLGHAGLMPVSLDVSHPPFRAGSFDRILIDAPCSNLGVLRRRPEARWNSTPEHVASLAVRQQAVLRGAATLLKPGGRLVYATCSAESEETVEVVRGFLDQNPMFRAVQADGMVPAALCREGFLRVWPGETEYDGFFAAVIERVGE